MPISNQMICQSTSFGECYAANEYYTKVIDEVDLRRSNEILINPFKFAKMAKLSNLWHLQQQK